MHRVIQCHGPGLVANRVIRFACYRVPGPDIISPIQSARLRTINSFSFTYGTVVVRAKMPRGDWLWPGSADRFTRSFLASCVSIIDYLFVSAFVSRTAVWLMPTDNAFGGWPRSGEIDMVELRGNNDLVCNGQQVLFPRKCNPSYSQDACSAI